MKQGSTVARLSISTTFQELGARRQIGLIPFVPAGYPDLPTLAATLPALEAAGASAIEIGIPFSDPVADGPVIQEAYTAALARRVRVADIFKTVEETRSSVSLPLVAMVSHSIVFKYGIERFAEKAAASGFDALLIPDLPPPEAEMVCRAIRAAGLDTVLLVAPSTSPARRADIARLASGFVYYLSVAGITGERDALPADLAANVQSLKKLTHQPVCVGFGISQPRHVAQLRGVADGAIVGSGLVRRMKQCAADGPQAIAGKVADYVRELLAGVGG